MPTRLSVVLSQGQSDHPAKRGLEEEIAGALLMERGIELTVISNLYDLTVDSTGILAMQGITGPMVVVSWLYDRAARWTLDRYDIHGQVGTVLLLNEDEDEEEDENEEDAEEAEEKTRVADERVVPDRRIYCLDLRAANDAAEFVAEIQRIAKEESADVVELGDWIGGTPTDEQRKKFENPTNDTALGGLPAASSVNRISEQPDRRWYPVIDFSRCTNCMECIDFCLFGVYGVDASDTILVEQPDNCRKGCPACSRVCPENAIVFPQHKSPAIAGALGEAVGTLKIDLSKLFGAPDAVEVAARERDEQLVLAGRDAVGIPRRQEANTEQPKDDLDDLIDALDDLDV